MSKNRFSRKISKYKLLAAVLVVVLLGIAMFVLEKTGVTDFYDKGSNNDISGEDFGPINFGPPTEEEQQAGNDQKAIIEQEEAERNDPSNQNKQTASVIITDAGQYDNVIEVRAFIPDHYENGTCTITFAKDAQQVTKEAPAYTDSSTTICTNPLITRSEFPTPGDWQLTVSYKSSGATGQSQPQKVTIN